MAEIEGEREPTQAERVAGEAYQAIGELAGSAGLLEHSEVQRMLTFFSTGWRVPGANLTPVCVPEGLAEGSANWEALVGAATRAVLAALREQGGVSVLDGPGRTSLDGTHDLDAVVRAALLAVAREAAGLGEGKT